MKPRLLIFAGLSAVGKSTLAETLGQKYGFPRLDKDDQSFPTNAIINQKLEEARGTGIDWWRTDECKKVLEPQLYNEVFNCAAEYLAKGQSCIIDGPLLDEAKDKDYLAKATKGMDALIDFFWFTAAPDKIKTNMYARNADRDYAKIGSDEAWQRYIDGIDFNFRPAFAHRLVDTTSMGPEALARNFELMLGLE